MPSTNEFPVLSENNTSVQKNQYLKNSERLPTHVVYITVLILLSVGVFFVHLGDASIYILDEAKNAGCAREMLEMNEWVVPTFNYSLRAQKPPLHYYFMVLGYKLFGVGELGARFFSALCGLFTVLTTFFFSRKYLGERTAFLSSLVLLSSLHIAIQFRLAVPDPYLIFFVTLSILSFHTAFTNQKSLYLWIAYGALGLAVLAKGPVALVIVGGVIGLFLIFSDSLRWPTIRFFLPWGGIGLFFLLVVPWYVAVTVATEGEWLQRFLFRENISRFLEPMEGHSGPFWLMPLLVIAGMLPFSIFSGQALYVAWQKRTQQPLLLVSLLTVALVVVFFSISGTKLPTYIGPCLPFMAIILGYFLNSLWHTGNLRKYRVAGTTLIYALLLMGLPVGLYLGLESEPHLASLKELSFYFIILPVGGVLSWLFAYRQQAGKMIGSLALSWIVLAFIAFALILPQLDQLNPVNNALEYISEEANVVSYKRFNSAFAFYLQKPIPQINTIDSLRAFLNEQPNSVIITRERYTTELDSLRPNPSVIFRQRQLFEPVIIELRKPNLADSN